MSESIELARTYLRPDKKLPTVWCGGCGLGIIMSAMIRAIIAVGAPKNRVAVVSGIGCTGRMPTYVDFNTLHTTHGRGLAFATGVKLARPELTVVAVMGDGDALAIGGNHFIHACRRNIDMTAIVANNAIYGMTGGQYSPTTPHGKRGTTAPYGNVEYAFDTAALAIGAGATFVARTSVYHAREAERYIERAIRHRGFSVVEIISNCYTSYGRMNKFASPVAMLEWMRDSSVTLKAAERMSAEELDGKFTRGVMVDSEKPEFIEAYDELATRMSSDPAAVANVRKIVEAYQGMADGLKSRDG
ncbi:MAG: 2-oxoacid:ferredoxin oxidoreductase subunit beta [Candidatus Eisenbacteria bacterium]|nr:2-oxoacid:ferredoxin oxidoreductase subunit beta [Candidatus Eisenbacteria bacterium]